MPYKKPKNNYQSFQSGKGGRMSALYFDMQESKAWRELTGNDIKVYLYMLKKYTAKYDRGNLTKSNSDNISCPRAEYEELLKMTHNTVGRCIDHLIELGFIKINHYKYLHGFVSTVIYEFSDMWQKYGESGFYIKESCKRNRNREYKRKEVL